MQGGHIVNMRGKFILRLPKLKLQLFVVLGNGVEAAVQICNLFRQLAQHGAMLHVPLLQSLGVIFLKLGHQCRQVCSFVHTSLHVSAIP